MMERPMLRSGCCRSAPWLVIVVKPLYARMHRVVPARKPSHPVSGGVRSAAVTAVLFLGEPMTAAHLAGFVLMLASLLLATLPARRG